MNETERNYLTMSLKRLEKWLPHDADTMCRMYEEQEDAGTMTAFSVEKFSEELTACVFSYQEKDLPMERDILLVFDEQERIIADTNGFLMRTNDCLRSAEIYDALCGESDWIYLEHYTLCGMMFPELPYPFCESGAELSGYDGMVLLYGNAYVTKAFRRRGIFRSMIEMMRDFALRNASGTVTLYSAMSMDPDIAYYGPDRTDTPYIYSYEKDEPVRLLNSRIAEKTGFFPVKLEETDPSPDSDGTKLWFCVRKETDRIEYMKNSGQ